MKCREVLGQIVMTIFYEVDPTDIKKQTGEFGKAFTKTCRGKTKEHVERWRKALEDVATIAGYHSRNWMVGIWGPPGIGKTTIATCVFNRFSSRFPFAAIITDIRECYPRLCLDERSAQLKLQAQMLSQIFNQKDIKISHLGVAQERLKDKKVLLVLGQLDALAKETRWFGPGSRIIITTEDLGILKAHGINHVYKVESPSNDEAFQIFCMNAFGQKQPHEGFWKLAREVMALAGKLPLGLKVLGSALRGMSKPEWERTLPRLKTSLDGNIGSIIQFSFDALCEEDKYLFLYIACLFNKESTTKVEGLLGKFLDVRQDSVKAMRNYKLHKSSLQCDHPVKLMCLCCKKHNDKFVPDPYYGGAQGFEKVLDLLEDALAAAAVGFFILYRKFRFQQDNQESNSSSLSLPSPATSVSRNWKHDVFPSFHGADVRRTFLSHIMESFRRKGIDPFIDNNIERSKSIGPELKEAIQGSKIAIVLLSRKYASSSWCLDELVEIMKWREVVGQIVMTIFYEVDPTDIKKQTGEFGKAFTKTCRGKTKEHVEKWRKALEDVATIAGYHSRNWRNEADMIEKIATDVSNMLNSCTPSRDFDGLVGMRAHMDRMEHLLRLDLDEVRMIGIWGPPGIGKTTIARFLFNQVSDRFQLSAIMVNIKGCYPRPCFDEYSAQLQLQNQMLSQMINHKGIMISHLGVAQERLRDKKVFLVLDEVDQLGQLDALAKETRWFGPGSRIIITTEDLGVLKAHGINHVYKVGYPSNDEAFQIFCMNAFGQKQPHEGFDEIAWEVTCLAGKLPLGLKVLGSALRGMSKTEWERTLPRLKTSLDGNIGSIIQFSFDALCDEDKYLFLYIACLFNNESTTKVEEVLANKFLDVGQGIHVLAQKSLISFEGEEIQMHTLLVQFGRETSRKQFVHHRYTKHQLLVGERDICEVLNDDTIDSRCFIGIHLDLSENEEILNISEKALERMHDFQFVRIGALYQRKRLSLALQDLIYHSPKLRSLKWYGYQNICLPSTFNPEFLVELDMRSSKLRKLWEGTKQLRNLKWMNLSYSRDLKELPNLSTATNLEELKLRNCSSLVELPSSIEKLTSLQILDLANCSSLVKLPAIENATNLRELKLQDCSSLIELPPSIGTATNLKKLDLNGCSSLVRLPSSIGDMTNLDMLDLSDCSKLEALPININLKALNTLSLTDCSQLKSFPELSTNIKYLWLTGTAIKEVPLSIMSWSRLAEFRISYFESLKEFPHALDIITELWLSKDIQEVAPWVKRMSRLRVLRLNNCNNLVSLPQLPDSLAYLYADNCKSLERLDCCFNNPDIRLHFPKCFKLNQEARDLIMHTSTSRYAMLPSSKIPACFNHRATSGDSLKIKLKESPLPTTLRFKACIMLVKGNEDQSGYREIKVFIRDEHNHLKVLRTPSGCVIYRVLKEHIYTFELEVEEVTSTELVFEFTLYPKIWKIGMLQRETRSFCRSSSPDLSPESSRAFSHSPLLSLCLMDWLMIRFLLMGFRCF
uniref:ADP-ribosyl cyclase/cyclic ADP-ribose hydrolase n=1 Tax=Arabidopsis thaliana TaxID=3702 RepID=A0A0S2RR99_ARATH|nr:RPP1-EstK [Arabidopsis thaliana]